MKRSKSAAVVIPVYRTDWSANEWKSFRRCLEVLSGYDIYFATFRELDFSHASGIPGNIRYAYFDKSCFSSIRSYNRLVLSEEFYDAFEEYEYILLYQLDAYVFRDELEKWCSAGFDYIGAPWFPHKRKFLNMFGKLYLNMRLALYFTTRKKGHWKFYQYQTGNGGFSLRKVRKFREITRKYREMFKELTSDDSSLYPEDILLLFELHGTEDRLKTPPFRTSLKFAFEENPEYAYTLNGDELPFGCHAWYLPEFSGFWKRFIR